MKIRYQSLSSMVGSLILMMVVNSQADETVTGDLDITGNVVTFGTLDEVTPASGVTLQFSDISSVAAFNNALSRPQAFWQWSRTESSSSTSIVPVMKLESIGGLSLPDPAAPTGSATVKIDPRPDQISILPKLELSGQTASSAAAVITRALGDARYLTQTNAATEYFRKDAPAYNFGPDSWAANANSMAFGPQAWAKGQDDPSFALGKGAVAGISSAYVGITLPDGIVLGEGGGAIAIGLNAYSTYYGLALGDYTRAAGGSTALGRGSISLGWNSVALGGGVAKGPGSLALGSLSFTATAAESSAAIGFNVFANGVRAMALGTDSNAIGFHSMALNGAWAHAENSVGIGPTVHSQYMDGMVVGTYPVGPPSGVATTRDLTDPLFVVGNGSGSGSTPHSNALVVRRNGNAEVNGKLDIAKDAAVSQNLSVTGTTVLGGAVTAQGGTFKGSLVVEGELDATAPDPAKTVISKNDQVILVPEQGDISMGEFRAGDLPVAAGP